MNTGGIETTTASEGTGRRVWVITGTSAGLGRSLAQAALDRGDYVIATARSLDGIRDFANDPKTSERAHIMNLDVTAPFAELRAVAGEAVAKWGRIDVLINNAGVCLLGITEEAGVEGYQKQFDTNFFGQLNVTNAFLPYMRARREGTIVFIGSRSSWRANLPLAGPYASSKAALTAAAEALAVELAPLNIRVLNVLPGGLRTQQWSNFLFLPTTSEALLPPATSQHQKDSKPTTNSANLGDSREGQERHLTDYAEMRKRQIQWAHSASVHINGDTEKCARAIIDVVTGHGHTASESAASKGKDWPDLNMLVLGADAEANIRDKCHAILRNLDEWRDVVRGVASNC